MIINNVVSSTKFGSMIINANDSGVARNILNEGYHSAADISLMKALMDAVLKDRSEILFYDVGANIGSHSLALAKEFGEKIKIRAFEAQREIFYMLCGTISINNLSNVHCYNVAVSDGAEELMEIAVPDYAKSNNFGGLELIDPIRSDNREMSKKGTEFVSAIKLDSINESVDFIKIDIEGMEDRALAGSSEIFNRCRPICMVEILKTNVDYIYNFFKKRNYIGFRKGIDMIMIPVERNLKIDGLDRIL